ncbi:MAG: PEGA domain-containing protein [Myxococcales bacterium]
MVHPPDAALQVNDRAYGPVSTALGPNGCLALEPGVYRIILSRAGYQTWRAEVAVDSEVEPIHVTLSAVE